MDSAPLNALFLAADQHDIPRGLAHAMAQVESSLNPWATRTEPAYRWLWDVSKHAPYRTSQKAAAAKLPPNGFPAPPGISQLTEWIAQQTSWGLLQVMGANARSLGLTGPLPQLCAPKIGADYGCRLLNQYTQRWLPTYGWRGVCQAFNAGSPDSRNGYPDKVASAAAALGIRDVFGER